VYLLGLLDGRAAGTLAAKFVGSEGAETPAVSADAGGGNSPPAFRDILREILRENDRNVTFRRSRFARDIFKRARRSVF